jgi:hypothetical protein
MNTIEHINGGTCAIRMTEAEQARCRERCAEMGDPPCWLLPSLTDSWPEGQSVHPCWDCSEATLLSRAKEQQG